jgi:hypothetical protein
VIGYLPPVTSLDLQFSSDPAALAALRRSVRGWLETLEIVEQDVAAVAAACSEVAADAIEAGGGELHGVLAGGDVVVRLTGPAGWGIEEHPSRYVAALLVDDVSIERADDGVAVVLRKSASRGLRL